MASFRCVLCHRTVSKHFFQNFHSHGNCREIPKWEWQELQKRKRAEEEELEPLAHAEMPLDIAPLANDATSLSDAESLSDTGLMGDAEADAAPTDDIHPHSRFDDSASAKLLSCIFSTPPNWLTVPIWL